MPNHSAIEKAHIRDLTIGYLPSNFAQKEARRDCPHFTLHHHQASYGQKKFSNIGVIYEFCRAPDPCKFHGTPLPLQMRVERRVDLLSELEGLDPPPYHDSTNVALCRSVCERIIATSEVTAGSVAELPATPPRNALSLLGLQSLARSGTQSSLGSKSSTSSTSMATSMSFFSSRSSATGRTTPQTSGSTTSASKGPGRPKRDEFSVTVYAYLRDGHPVATAEAVGKLTRRKQVQFKFWQSAIAQAFGFDLQSTSRPKFELYLPLGEEWTDCIEPMVLLRGQPVLVRGTGVRDMPGLDRIKPLLSPPYNPIAARPLPTLLAYSSALPSSPARTRPDASLSGSGMASNPASIFADIFGGPPDVPSVVDQPSPGPSRKREHEQAGSSSRNKKRLLKGGARVRAVRAPTPDDVIILSDSDDSRPEKGKGKEQASFSDDQDSGAPKKGKGQDATADNNVIDLTV